MAPTSPWRSRGPSGISSQRGLPTSARSRSSGELKLTSAASACTAGRDILSHPRGRKLSERRAALGTGDATPWRLPRVEQAPALRCMGRGSRQGGPSAPCSSSTAAVGLTSSTREATRRRWEPPRRGGGLPALRTVAHRLAALGPRGADRPFPLPRLRAGAGRSDRGANAAEIDATEDEAHRERLC